MQASVPQPRRVPGGAPVHYERHRPEQTTLYRLVQRHAATFFAGAEVASACVLPQFVRDEFDAFSSAASWPTVNLFVERRLFGFESLDRFFCYGSAA